MLAMSQFITPVHSTERHWAVAELILHALRLADQKYNLALGGSEIQLSVTCRDIGRFI